MAAWHKKTKWWIYSFDCTACIKCTVLNIKFCKQVLLHRGNVKKMQCFLKWLKADYLHDICRLPVLYMSEVWISSKLSLKWTFYNLPTVAGPDNLFCKESDLMNHGRIWSSFAKRLSKYCFSPKKNPASGSVVISSGFENLTKKVMDPIRWESQRWIVSIDFN